MNVEELTALLDRLRHEPHETEWLKFLEVLNDTQQNTKIHNLMAELVRKGKIENWGSRAKPAWHTAKKLGM